MLRSQVDAHVPVNQRQEGYAPTSSAGGRMVPRGMFATTSEWYDVEYSDSFAEMRDQWGLSAPMAIPCPWRYTWTPAGASSVALYTHFTGASWADLDAAAFAVLLDGTRDGFIGTVKSNARDYERISYNVAYWRISIAKASPTDTIVATLTISGTNGYTVTRTFGPLDVPAFIVRTPVAWDEQRTVTLTWTGGGTTASMLAYRPNRWRMLKRGAIPAGWTACSAPRGMAVGNLRTNGVRTGLGDYETSIFDNYNDGANRQDFISSPSGGTYWSPRLGDVGPRSLCEPVPVESRTQTIIRAGDRFAPWAGIPFYDGSAWKRYLSNRTLDSVVYGNRLQRATKIVQVINSASATTVTIDIQRDANWQIGGTGTTVVSDSWSHGGTGWEAYEIPASYPLGPTNGAFDGAVTGMTAANGFIAFEDPVPLPYDIPVSDGDVIPGAYHTSAVEDAAGLNVIEASGDTLDYSDIPSTPGMWRGRLTGLDPGVYRLRAFNASNADIDSGGTMFERSVGWDSSSMCVLSGTLNFRPTSTSTAGWPAFGKNTRTDRTWEYVKAVKYDITPYALSAGANELNTNATTWGVSAPSNGFLRAPLFCKYTAAVAGTHTFTMSAVNIVHTGRPWCAYVSATDQYASQDAPDVLDLYTGLSVVASFLTAPPTALNGFACVVIDGTGTGDFAGHDNELAVTEGNGTAGNTTYDWRFFAPTVGMLATSGSTAKIWDGTSWVTRGTVLSFTRTLAIGDTVFMRLQHYVRTWQQSLLLGIYPQERWTSVDGAGWAITMTVAEP